MADQLGVNNNPLMALLAQLGGATGQNNGGNSIESLIRSLSGPKTTNVLAPVASPETIGASNNNLNSNFQQHYQNMFNMIGNDAANSLAWAQQAAAQRAANEAAARQLAIQKLLVQKNNVPTSSGGNSSSGGGSGGSASPTPNLNSLPSLPNANDLKFPDAKPVVAPKPSPKAKTVKSRTANLGHPTKGGIALEQIVNRNERLNGK